MLMESEIHTNVVWCENLLLLLEMERKEKVNLVDYHFRSISKIRTKNKLLLLLNKLSTLTK